MHLAEKLYLSGVITYPRTETTAYAPSFDLRGLIGKFSNDNTYGEFA